MIGLLASRKLILKPGHTILGYQSLHRDAGRGRFFRSPHAEKMTCEYLTVPSRLESPLFFFAARPLRWVVL